MTTVNSQSIVINKQLKDFEDTFDLSTPLKAGITFSYLTLNGNKSLWHDASASIVKEYFPQGDLPNTPVGKRYKSYLLNGVIKEVNVY